MHCGYGVSGGHGYLQLGDDSGSYTQIHCETGSHSGNYVYGSGAWATRNMYIDFTNEISYMFIIKY